MAFRSLRWLPLLVVLAGCQKDKSGVPPTGASMSIPRHSGSAAALTGRAREAELQREADVLIAAQEKKLLDEALKKVDDALKAERFDAAQEALREAALLAPTDVAVGRLQRK